MFLLNVFKLPVCLCKCFLGRLL